MSDSITVRWRPPTASRSQKPAHTTPGPENTWETLDEHLERVGTCAAHIADKFGATSFGQAAGLLHDLGKAKPEFQARLRGSNKLVSHSGEGAKVAVEAA